jgi:hypothetical protein
MLSYPFKLVTDWVLSYCRLLRTLMLLNMWDGRINTHLQNP